MRVTSRILRIHRVPSPCYGIFDSEGLGRDELFYLSKGDSGEQPSSETAVCSFSSGEPSQALEETDHVTSVHSSEG